jgi:hypothetical protein
MRVLLTSFRSMLLIDLNVKGSLTKRYFSVFHFVHHFGIFPTNGLQAHHASAIKFKWFAAKTWITMSLLLFGMILSVMEFVVVAMREVTIFSLGKCKFLSLKCIKHKYFICPSKSTLLRSKHNVDGVLLLFGKKMELDHDLLGTKRISVPEETLQHL